MKAEDRFSILAKSILEPNSSSFESLTVKITPFFNFPKPSCKGLFTVAENIAGIKDVAGLKDRGGIKDILKEISPDKCKKTIQEIINWAALVNRVPVSHELRKEIELSGSIQDKDGTKRPPFRQMVNKHPIWSALWYRHESDNTEAVEKYQWLQAYFLVSYVLMVIKDKEEDKVEDKDKDPPYSNRVKEAGLMIRKLHFDDFGEFFDDCDLNTDHPEGLQTSLIKIKEAGEDPEIRQGLGALAVMLGVAFNLIQEEEIFRKHTGGSGGGGVHKLNLHNPNILNPDNALYSATLPPEKYNVVSVGNSICVVHQTLPFNTMRNEISESGIDPSEYSNSNDTSVDVGRILNPDTQASDVKLGELQLLSTLYAAARAKMRRMAMISQRLRSNTERIRRSDLSAIINTLETIYAESLLLPGAEGRKIRYVLILAAIAIATGTSEKFLRKYNKIEGEEKDVKFALVETYQQLPRKFKIAFNPTHNLWIRPFEAPIRHPLQERHRAFGKENKPRVIFRDVLGVGQHLTLLSKEAIFPSNNTNIKKIWNKAISPKLAKAGVSKRWRNLEAMSAILPSWFASIEEGEHLSSALLFCREDILASTHRYYTLFDRRKLMERYRHNVVELWKSLTLDDSNATNTLFRFQAFENSKPLKISWVGDDRVPTHLSIKKLVTKLKRKINSSQKRLNGIENSDIARYEHHNLVVTYTALGLAICTGFRSVRTPIVDLTAIHHASRTFVLQEKDCTDGSHARLVVIPESVYEQVILYTEYLTTIFTQFSDDIPKELEVKATKYRDKKKYNHVDKSQFNHNAFKLDLLKTFFYILPSEKDENKWVPHEFTGNLLKSECDKLIDKCWPVENAGRHFLRTFLVQQKECPATAINALLGHWFNGEEPWTTRSTLDPVTFREVIVPHQEKLMKSIGFKALQLSL
jgi:hypothetical protein